MSAGVRLHICLILNLLRSCFEDLHYRRVEWKCNDRNKPSERAALRLGFKYEGTFRKHMIVKGRRRDSAWFSVLDDEWKESVGEALEKWLSTGNFDETGGQRRMSARKRKKANERPERRRVVCVLVGGDMLS